MVCVLACVSCVAGLVLCLDHAVTYPACSSSFVLPVLPLDIDHVYLRPSTTSLDAYSQSIRNR